MSKLLPGEDRLLLKEMPDEKTDSGLVLAYTQNKSAKAFEVVEVGPGKVLPNGERAEIPYSRGDKVYVDLSMAYEIRYHGENYRVVETPYVWAYVGV